ncbi:hypothetical protein BCR39DRAFT_508474 [Naematelia encephala]|uniref:Uncharacterized protein n=1 Tax=Naematelia encephala TaxID=71784 RepID=A0A1Y2AEV7_9TREE|nr:hypothetical protein BCR39DRAFT_508474 [Naematelia encephala]
MISTIIQSRSTIYSQPGLRGEVDGHGSDRIRKKMDTVLKKLAMDYGVDGGIVQELGKAGGKKRTASEGGTPKKQKVKRETGDDASDILEYDNHAFTITMLRFYYCGTMYQPQPPQSTSIDRPHEILTNVALPESSDPPPVKSFPTFLEITIQSHLPAQSRPKRNCLT